MTDIPLPLPQPALIRIRYVQQGGHIHCRLFTARQQNQTFANCGALVFSAEEWPSVSLQFERGGIEILPEVER